jgi:3-hydroxyisobutyrate dehydrogenase-like beta-hydroxyacid dehydrogenase
MSAPTVTVIGLGAMGRALAHAFLAAGHPTTVWNRTPSRADELTKQGAVAAPTVADAVAASALTVVCVLDRAAVESVLDGTGDRLAGASLVNFTSSTPEEARVLAGRATGAGARYLDGKIMVPTPLIGTDDAFFLYAGDRTVLDDHAEALQALGGEAALLGDDPGLAALYDLAMLDVFFNGMAAFLHAAALVGADGVPAERFLPYAQRIVTVLQASMPGLAAGVDRGEHAGDEDNLVMELAGLDHIVEASRARGIDLSVPGLPRALAAAAVEQGHGGDSFSRTIDVLRQPARV